MKKAVFLLCAVFATFSAYGQSPDTTSTVVGKKLNFEVPIFGITMQGINPTWSIVTFDEMSGGFNYLKRVPGEMKHSGFYGDLSIITLRYRPWRNGNVFSIGITGEVDLNRLHKGHSFADDGSIIPTPESRKKSSADYLENISGLKIGYVREFGKWKAGAFVAPGIGTTQLRNAYSTRGILGIDRQDNLYSRYGFRLEFKAGIWYQGLGITVGYRPAVGKNSGNIPMYDSMQLGLSVRY